MSDKDNYDMSNLDFGDDDDVILPADPQFDAWLKRAAPSVNAPPATPRSEMWSAIQTANPAPPVGARILEFRRARWLWPLSIAAALLVGVALDRISVPAPSKVAVVPPAPVAPAAPDTIDPSRLYRLAAVQTLTQAEALLTTFRSNRLATRNPEAARQLGTWGREVLTSTRLLLDSPAGDDPQLRRLLDDIELVLVQIIELSGAPPDSSDRNRIDGAVRDRDLIPRIRTAVPAGALSSASDD